MGDSVVVRALEAQFESIRRTELARLRKKTNRLTPADRELLEAVTADIVRALLAQPAAVLDEGRPELMRALVDLFKILPPPDSRDPEPRTLTFSAARLVSAEG